jgi:drug/metabolite transporter (DMT)-like permease
MATNTNKPVKSIAGISMPVLALVWVCVAWGSTWIASKMGVAQMPALQLCAMRQIAGGVIWIVFYSYKREAFPRKSQWPAILMMSLLNFFLSNSLSTWGVEYISSGLGAILGAIFPLWMVIIFLFRGRRLVPLAVIGMIVGFGGVCIIFYDHLKDFLIPDFRLGIFLSLTATLTWAFGSLITQKQMNNFNPYFGLGIQMLISGICLYGVALLTGKHIPFAAINLQSWLSLIYLVVIGSVITFAAYVYTLKHLPIEIASIYAYMNPVVAVLMSSMIFKDKITTGIFAGGLVTLAGVYLVNYAIRKNKV